MTDQGHGQGDGVTGAAADRAAKREAAEAAETGAVAREPEAAGGETNDEAASPESGAAGDNAEAGDASQGEEPTETPAAPLEDALGEAQRLAREHRDRALRAQAELENVRRRMARDIENARKFALERFVSELLPVKDSLELGLAAASEEGASAASIAEGVVLTLRQLEQTLDKFGIRCVDPAGEPFDPDFHQAVTMRESDAARPDTVLTVVQKGYLLNERLVRPAMVIVAK